AQAEPEQVCRGRRDRHRRAERRWSVREPRSGRRDAARARGDGPPVSGVGAHVGTLTDVRVAGAGRELLPTDGPMDVFLANGVIADMARAGLLRPRGEVLDAGGRWLVPGLWDHHVHVVQWALVARRRSLGHADSAAHAARIMGDTPILADGRRIG